MKKFLIAMACLFGILTIVLYFTSLVHWDGSTARMLGTDTTVNIQGTVFCAACAIICALNVVGAVILSYLESLNYNSRPHYKPTTTVPATPQKKTAPLSPEQIAEKQSFLKEIESNNSMVEIWNTWRKYNLSSRFIAVNDYIRQSKDQEQLHGVTNDIQSQKETIKNLLQG